MNCPMKRPNSEPEDEEFEHRFSFSVEFNLIPAIMFLLLLAVVGYMLYLTFSR